MKLFIKKTMSFEHTTPKQKHYLTNQISVKCYIYFEYIYFIISEFGVSLS